MSIINIIGIATLLLILVTFTGCDTEDSRPSYQEIENIVSSGKITMEWSEEEGLVNVYELESELSDDERTVFSDSLEWLGTESNIPFSALSGKTAAQIVDIANCLKSSTSASYESCMGK